MNNLGPDPSA